MNTSTIHAAIADHLSDGDGFDSLDALFAGSLLHLQRYRNINQPFYEGTSRDWFEAYADRPEQFARGLVAKLRPSGDEFASICIPGDPPAVYGVVDYEVSPLRTAGGFQFEDGRSGRASGGGGMDLLLSASDGVPVIGEIKGRGDTSIFVALVQALTYASEILTEHQMERLRISYPTAFGRYRGAPVCEVLIFHEESDAPRLLREASQIATRLLTDPQGSVARHIRRITFAGVQLDSSPRPSFSLRLCVRSMDHLRR